MSWFNSYVKPALDFLTAIGTLVALGALILAVVKNRKDEEVRKQQDLLDQCKRTLEWGYDALMKDAANGIMPAANRLNWLTAARHVIAHQKLKNRITLEPQVQILDDFEEFWRHRLHLALSHIELSHRNYWILGNIDLNSALIVVDFSEWPQGKLDTSHLSAVEVQLLKDRNGLNGNAGKGIKGLIKQLEWQNRNSNPAP